MAHNSLNILIIDDDQGDRTMCQRALRSAWGDNLQFMEADSGESGLEAIEKHPLDCVLLDHSLPGIDGIEVLKRIRVNHPYLPVVMIDGKGNDVIAVQSMKEGAQDYIGKNTITPPILQRLVQMAIEHCNLQKNSQEQRASLEIFTHALAHDLKEPVRTILSFVDMIEDWRNLTEKSQRFFYHIRKAADRMNALIDTVYLYTRLDAAEQMEMIPCDISDIVNEAQENLAQLIQEHTATIICNALPQVHANRLQLIQLFQNLFTNAVRHCEAPVTINVSAEEHKDHWQLVVRDNGPGIAPEYLEKIFDPFTRLSHRKENKLGLGLGLAINRKIVESYGGKIWCQSQLDNGTMFLFTLLKVPDAVRKLARVLLVDDNELDIEINQVILIERGKLRCDVLTARDGKEALALLQDAANGNNPIDLMLLDINMPVMGGFELLAKIQNEQLLPDTLVVMCTSSAYDKDERMATSLGAAGYIVKPPYIKKVIIMLCAGRFEDRTCRVSVATHEAPYPSLRVVTCKVHILATPHHRS